MLASWLLLSSELLSSSLESVESELEFSSLSSQLQSLFSSPLPLSLPLSLPSPPPSPESFPLAPLLLPDEDEEEEGVHMPPANRLSLTDKLPQPAGGPQHT